MLKSFLNRISPDSNPDAYGSGIDSECTVLLLLCIVLFSIILFGGIWIYSYIKNLKEKIKKLKQDNTKEKSLEE